MDYETITLTAASDAGADREIRVLTLNRPDVMNAMNTRMFMPTAAASSWR